MSKCIPSEKGAFPKGKNLLVSKFFPFRIDPFHTRLGVQESKQEITKVLYLIKKQEVTESSLPYQNRKSHSSLPYEKMAETLPSISSPFGCTTGLSLFIIPWKGTCIDYLTSKIYMKLPRRHFSHQDQPSRGTEEMRNKQSPNPHICSITNIGRKKNCNSELPWNGHKFTKPLNPGPAGPGYALLCKQCRSRSVDF